MPLTAGVRKRKSDAPPTNERLSKRFSKMRLGGTGTPPPGLTPPPPPLPADTDARLDAGQTQPEFMDVDNDKHRVFIANLDDELSGDESEGGLLIYNPHPLMRRIPRIIPSADEGKVAGTELVLYSEPKALSVDEANDSVRKAVIEARARLRQNINNATTTAPAPKLEPTHVPFQQPAPVPYDDDAMDLC